MIRFPNCKINIGLSVVEKRADGYHNIETVFYPLAVEDALEIVPASDGNSLHVTRYTLLFQHKPPLVPPKGEKAENTEVHRENSQLFGNGEDNLVIQAYKLLLRHFPLPPLHFHLHKVIPIEAGLGGGSSDAACTLKMLNEMFKLSLSKQQLHDFAEQLGADCPFFIENIPVFATGKGEVLQKIELDLSSYKILIVKPPCSVSTKEAYGNIVPQKAKYPLPEAIKQPLSEWKNLIFNDFEPFAFAKHPEIKHIKATLYDHGALYASMSGSGSAVYGIFDRMPNISFSENYTIFQI